MADLPDDILEEVGDAKVGGGGVYFNHGDYITMIDKWFYQKIQDRCIILETLVIEARKKTVMLGKEKVTEEPNEPGSKASSTANFDGKGKLSAPSNSRAPVLGLYGFTEGKVDKDVVKKALTKATSDAQPMRGMLVALSTFPSEIRSNKGNYITGLGWSCVAKPGTGINAPELAKARVDALAVGPEKCLEVTLAQLKKFRAEGAAIALPSGEGDAAASAAADSAAADAAPDLGGDDDAPGLPEEKPADPIEVAVSQGWKVHPKDPSWYYRGKETKKKTDILAGR